ncbi:MAG: SPOR domain-containing protein [Candidatus Polarisedimenticolia bacterium]
MSRADNMASSSDEAAREFQLETRHLAFLIAVVMGLCVASFLLGRWVERQNEPASVAAVRAEGGASVKDEGDVAGDLTYFDTLKTDKPAPLDPERKPAPARSTPARSERSAITPPQAATPRPADPRRSVNEGVMIQVFASKDRAAADAIRKRLRGKGYTALLVSDSGSWKVRVGPYADREEAERSAAVIRQQENLKTWIP